jgi:hypothetical protein
MISTGVRKILIIALVAICVGAGSARAAPEPAAHASAAAPQTLKKSVLGAPAQNGTDLLPAYRDLGVGVWQTSLRWDTVALSRPASPTDPSDPAYLWPPELGPAIDEAVSLGMQVSITLSATPRWANGGLSPRWVPTNPTDFANFAAATSKKYPSVHLWMIWGEPNRSANLAPFTGSRPTGPLTPAQQLAPHNYAQILDASYGALKSVNPANLVIGGNTYLSGGTNVIQPYQWIKNLVLPDGSRPRLDMYGHNPYGYRRPSLKGPPSHGGQVDFVDLPRLVKAIDRVFPNTPPLFLSEWGVQASKTGKRSDLGFALTFKRQAKWIHDAFRIARGWDRVYTMGWPHAVATEISPNGGLLDINGNPTPTYYAFKSS